MNHNCCEPDFSKEGLLRLAREHVQDLKDDGMVARANDADVLVTAIETYIKSIEENSGH